jgi:hypothetical protein
MIRSNRSVRRFCVLLVAMLGFVLAAPAASFAQNINPTDEEYGNGVLGISAGGNSGNEGTSFSGSSGGGSPAPSSDSGISSLPFTGLDVAAIAAIGLGLVGAGLVVRRAATAGESI